MSNFVAFIRTSFTGQPPAMAIGGRALPPAGELEAVREPARLGWAWDRRGEPRPRQICWARGSPRHRRGREANRGLTRRSGELVARLAASSLPSRRFPRSQLCPEIERGRENQPWGERTGRRRGREKGGILEREWGFSRESGRSEELGKGFQSSWEAAWDRKMIFVS